MLSHPWSHPEKNERTMFSSKHPDPEDKAGVRKRSASYPPTRNEVSVHP